MREETTGNSKTIDDGSDRIYQDRKSLNIQQAYRQVEAIYSTSPALLRVTFQVLLVSTVLGILSNAAVYVYALRAGARAPVEGTPFLSLLVTFFGLVLFSLIRFFVPLLVAVVDRLTKFNRRLIRNQLIARGITSITVIIANLIASIFAVAQSLQFVKWKELLSHQLSPKIFIAIFIFAFTLSALLLWLAGKPKSFVQKVSARLTFGSFFVVAFLMFYPPNIFDGVLRVTRFGGGIETAIYLQNGSIAEGNLFFVTADRVVLYKQEENAYFEYKWDMVSHLSYSESPYWYLPENRWLQWTSYFAAQDKKH